MNGAIAVAYALADKEVPKVDSKKANNYMSTFPGLNSN